MSVAECNHSLRHSQFDNHPQCLLSRGWSLATYCTNGDAPRPLDMPTFLNRTVLNKWVRCLEPVLYDAAFVLGGVGRGTAIVARYKSQLPVLAALVDAPDGRTLKGAERQIRRLTSCEITASDGNDLSTHLDLLRTAISMQARNIPGKTDDEIEAAVKALQSVGSPSDWPLEVQEALLKRRLRQQREQDDLEGILTTLTPWAPNAGPATFDALAPTLAAIKKPSPYKVQMMGTVFFKQVFVPLLMTGDANSDRVYRMCNSCAAEFEAADLMQLDPTLTQCYKEAIDVWRAVETILDCTMDDRYAVHGLMATSSQDSSG